MLKYGPTGALSEYHDYKNHAILLNKPCVLVDSKLRRGKI